MTDIKTVQTCFYSVANKYCSHDTDTQVRAILEGISEYWVSVPC